MVRCAFGILLCATVLSGCAVHEVHKDHDLIRTTLLDLYTNQIIDNLVRAKNGMPIIQLDYTQVSAMVTIANSVSGSDSQAVTANNLLTIPAATLAATRTVVTSLMGNLGNMNTNQVTIGATPLITSNEVYDAYLQFLDEEKNPGSLMVTRDPPNPGDAHICKKCDGKYYWVPVIYRDLFFKLALLTTAQRGKPLAGPDSYFSVVVLGIKGNPIQGTRQGQPFGDLTVTVLLNKKIPNDTGTLVFDGDDTPYEVRIDEDKPGGKLSESEFATVYVKEELYDNFKKLFPRKAKITLNHTQPKVATTEDMLSKINFQLQQIQFNQLRQPSGP